MWGGETTYACLTQMELQIREACHEVMKEVYSYSVIN